jgi:hypothetical protein
MHHQIAPATSLLQLMTHVAKALKLLALHVLPVAGHGSKHSWRHEPACINVHTYSKNSRNKCNGKASCSRHKAPCIVP